VEFNKLESPIPADWHRALISVIDPKIARERDVWLSVFLLLILSYFCSPFIFDLFPTTHPLFLAYHISIIYLTIVLSYFLFRYGGLKIEEYLPKKKGYLVLGVSCFILLWTYLFISRREGFDPELAEQFQSLFKYQYIMVLIATVAIGPFLEETLYRRFIFEILRNKYHLLIAVLITSGIETSLHYTYSWDQLIFIFCLSVFNSIVYLLGGLGVSVLFHSAHNALIILLL